MKKFICLWLAVLLVVSVALCCAPPDRDEQIEFQLNNDEQTEVQSKLVNVQKNEIYSLDKYDGVLINSAFLSWASFSFQTANSGSHYARSTAFFTFELPEMAVEAQSASLEIFVSEFFDSCAYAPGQDPHVYLFVIPWSVSQDQYDKWNENCKYHCPYAWCDDNQPDWPDSWHEPSGCEVVPHSIQETMAFEMSHDDIEKNQGWYKLDSPRFLDYIRDKSASQQKYFSFEMKVVFKGTLNPCCAYPSLDLYFEDGGNHGGTGNLPTLTISY